MAADSPDRGRDGSEPAPPAASGFAAALCGYTEPGCGRASLPCAGCLHPREPGFTLGVRVKPSCQSVKDWLQISVTLRVVSAENVLTKFPGVCYLPAFMLWALGALHGQTKCLLSKSHLILPEREKNLLHLVLLSDSVGASFREIIQRWSLCACCLARRLKS